MADDPRSWSVGLMDIHVPEIPASYDAYRAGLRAFLSSNMPKIEMKPRSGLRVPDTAEDVDALRNFIRALHDAGYRSERFVMESCDPHEQRILEDELATAPVAFLGNPLVAGALKMFGSPQQQEKYLPAISRGDHIWSQLFSEPDAGSDLSNLKTRGELDGDVYVVSGQKVWSTWAQWSDYGYLLARTEGVPGPAGITAFVLDMRTSGVDVRPLREMTGTTDFNEVFLDEVRIPVTDVIGKTGDGWRVTTMSLAAERGGILERGAGMVEELIDTARAHTRRNHPAIESHDVRQELARFAARARIQRAIASKIATRAAKGKTSVSDAPMGKIWFSELNLEMAEFALRLQGPRSALAEGDPAAYRDGVWQDRFLYARAWTIAGGSNEIMRNMIAERGLGLPREPRGT
jgi:alkylation response protein AidB-like acyl-CoA dehydrogenase